MHIHISIKVIQEIKFQYRSVFHLLNITGIVYVLVWIFLQLSIFESVFASLYFQKTEA